MGRAIGLDDFPGLRPYLLREAPFSLDGLTDLLIQQDAAGHKIPNRQLGGVGPGQDVAGDMADGLADLEIIGAEIEQSAAPDVAGHVGKNRQAGRLGHAHQTVQRVVDRRVAAGPERFGTASNQRFGGLPHILCLFGWRFQQGDAQFGGYIAGPTRADFGVHLGRIPHHAHCL